MAREKQSISAHITMIALLDGGYYAHWSAATKRPCTMAELRRKLTAKFGLDVDLWLAEDCPRDACWRRSVYAGYKRGRAADVRTQKTASTSAPLKTLSGPNLEADDCIAIAVRDLIPKGTPIVIISSDTDFLQLCSSGGRDLRSLPLWGSQLSESNVTVVDINMRPVRGHRGLNCVIAKALGGDSTDGIRPAWRGCGPATVDRCLRSAEYLRFKLADKDNLAGFMRNKALVDFAAIPERYKQGMHAAKSPT
jgi:hypothetical protein